MAQIVLNAMTTSQPHCVLNDAPVAVLITRPARPWPGDSKKGEKKEKKKSYVLS